MSSSRLLAVAITTTLALGLVACATGGDDNGSSPFGPGGASQAGGTGGTGNGNGNGGSGANNAQGGTAGDGGDWTQSVCMLHNCDKDDECKGCPHGRHKCDTTKHYCLACVPGDPNSCGSGKKCTEHGVCIDETANCPVDVHGEPTLTCNNDNDCIACDDDHQACDPKTHKCVQCSDTNTFACTKQQYCNGGKCVAKCPANCTKDEDCEKCGSLAHPGNACNEKTHHCGECSATHPCPEGKVCGPQGMCVKVCGAPGKPKGSCEKDSDCGGCEGDTKKCHKPVNGGLGKCGISAKGCSDLPGHFAVLPDPWGKITNLCSKDEDCQGQGIDLNAGKLLRDMTGLKQIKDANIHYGMNVCASVSVSAFGKTVSCGVCVPCREDSDCEPIKFDPLIKQAFGPIGSLAARVLLKEVFGDAPHQLNMYCQPVAGDYGVCAPCIDFLHECAVSSTAGDGCNNDWECASGERCNLKTHKCEKYDSVDCAGDPTKCNESEVCAWNGNRYCCRAPWTPDPNISCYTDADCQNQKPGTVCAWSGKGFDCVPPLSADQCK